MPARSKSLRTQSVTESVSVPRGGPFDSGNSLVGNTDLLINFAYRLALESGQPNIGLASAVSIVIFMLVGAISYIGFRQSAALEEVN